ncbi:hypothetical protein RFI_00165 [Reticulomyxa filosa]|uniref:Uncharacterized protein n=1 Tax=Reticulomyxa filosa TaxID=46433 RepID=X6PFD4_RETFI|nr:hypothetical protein RFI_00165 [Reticulomyxa filosa]|eukprot:ETO36896.1 hypothetical protein RFI_00165 [Reticulomyxa filosa]
MQDKNDCFVSENDSENQNANGPKENKKTDQKNLTSEKNFTSNKKNEIDEKSFKMKSTSYSSPTENVENTESININLL